MLPLRLLAGTASAGLVLAGLALASPAASAEIGTMLVTPSSGNQDDLLSVDTLVECPASSVTFRIDLVGTGIQAETGTMTSTTDLDLAAANDMGGYNVPVGEVFKDTFQRNNLKDPTGDYTLSFLCTDVSGFVVEAEINATVTFTPTTGDYNAMYTQAATSEDTSTSLAVAPPDLVNGSQDATLTATVTPSDVVGSVQFKSGGANVGSPRPVSGGTATYTGHLPAGNASLTANFVPTNENVFSPSTSAPVPYVVVGAPSITGTVKVASTVTCATSPGGTQTFVWLKEGTATSVTTKSVKIPDTWFGANIACRVTVTQGVGSVTRTSPAKAVALGNALQHTQAPVASGTPTVGSKLTCKPGSWSPTASSYAFKWLRDGSAIPGQTSKTYLLVRADRGHKVQCKVTAKRSGYANGVAKSAARLIR